MDNSFEKFYKEWCFGSKTAFIACLNLKSSEEADSLIGGEGKLENANCDRIKFIKYLENNVVTQDREDALTEAIKELDRRLHIVNRISSTGFLDDRKDKK